MKLKLDLHTHCFEALNYVPPNYEAVRIIIEKVKEKGLDGIAITEHSNISYGLKAKEIAEKYIKSDIIIIPGQEIDVDDQQIVELYIGDAIFRFLAHPGYPYSVNRYPLKIVDGLHGIEIENSLHQLFYNDEYLIKKAEDYDLMLLRNSDAHQLDNIGSAFNEISIDELIKRVKKGGNNGLQRDWITI
jgi:predicted metal-dependent phosphoesterase TrpH